MHGNRRGSHGPCAQHGGDRGGADGSRGGGGYILKTLDDDGRWEVSACRWEPSQIIVNEGDEVTLEILGVNGDEHPTVIGGYDISFAVKRGELTTVTLTADNPGVFPFRCGVHMPSMTGELIGLPAS